nr:MAG TPA: hypothetical protein [Caudoviricetes sp.]
MLVLISLVSITRVWYDSRGQLRRYCTIAKLYTSCLTLRPNKHLRVTPKIVL